MFATCQLGAVCYYVNDVDRTEAFYRDVLGLAVQRMDNDKIMQIVMSHDHSSTRYGVTVNILNASVH